MRSPLPDQKIALSHREKRKNAIASGSVLQRKQIQENIGFCFIEMFLQEDGQNQRDDRFLATEVRFLNFLERLFDQVDHRFVIASDRRFKPYLFLNLRLWVRLCWILRNPTICMSGYDRTLKPRLWSDRFL